MAPDVTWPAIDLFFRSHPWHGVAIGPDAPRQVTVFVEIVPSDTVKYELDKDSGLLKVDRPQLYSNVCPSPYGFVPRTLCGTRVAALAEEKTGRRGLVGDDEDISHLPTLLVDRLEHYFLTYKQAPSESHPACELTRVYGRDEAFEVIRRSQADYEARFGATLGPILGKG